MMKAACSTHRNGMSRKTVLTDVGHLDPLAPQSPGRRPDMSRMLFLDPHCRELYRDWNRKARGLWATYAP
jgi:hypothetical protein